MWDDGIISNDICEDFLHHIRNYDSPPCRLFYDYLRSNFSELYKRDNSRVNYYEFSTWLMNGLVKYDCDNRVLLTAVTDLITIYYLKIFETHEISPTFKKYRISRVLENLQNHYDRTVFEYDEGVHVLVALTRDVYFDERKRFMEILIKYGLVRSIPEQSYFYRERTIAIIGHKPPRQIHNLIPGVEQFRREQEEQLSVARTIMERAEEYLLHGEHRSSLRSMKRMYLAALEIQIILMKEQYPTDPGWQRLIKGHCSTLKMYFAAVPEPFVTINEIKYFLRVYLTHKNNMHLLDTYIDLYKTIMPESSECFQPRKLIDLSRIQVRECLFRCKVFPAIEKLKIPETLKDFIRIVQPRAPGLFHGRVTIPSGFIFPVNV